MKPIISRILVLAFLSYFFYPASSQTDRELFSIGQVLSAPFPTSLTTAPHHNMIAWVQNKEGIRNIRITEGPEFKAKQLTGYTEDKGFGISDLQFTPDEKSLIYVHGGGPNRQGELPNPVSLPDGGIQEIRMISISDGSTTKISPGSNPSVSPDGKKICFIRDRQVWIKDLENDSEPRKMFTIRGTAGSLRWSPDGHKLAFVSSRRDHSFIGIYDLLNNTIEYLTPGVDHDRYPEWSPDGKKIAFIRIPNERQGLPFQPERTALPWSIRVYDFDSSSGTEIWKAEEGRGSAFRFISARNQILWGADNCIVFPWEKDGWTHLYSISVNTGKIQLLTPGPFEVQFVSLSPDGNHIVYSSNQDDIDRQHIWKVKVTGGTADLLTPGKGIEWSPGVLPDNNTITFLASDGITPAHAEILINNHRKWISESLPSDFPSKHLVEPQQVIFSASDGMNIHGQLFLPPDYKKEGKYPALVFFHGGSRRQMLLGFHHRQYYHNSYSFNQYMASRGFIVLSVNYRSGIGYGMEFREAINYGARGASEFHDVLGAGLYLRSRKDVIPDKIALWGGSYGGYLTALGLARASYLFAAGVDLHGVHDWNVVIGNFVPGFQPDKNRAAAELAFRSSPMASVDTWRSPVLVIHGDDDRNVPFSETVDLVESLRKQGVEVEQLIFPDEVHGFLLHRNWVAAYQAAADFLVRKLGE
jgi:dipeptidyl aminopeptidase/acylaminoacyl peptidase